MFCKYCGTEVTDDTKFCSNCGAKLVDDPFEKASSFVDSVTKEVDEKTNKVIDDVGKTFNRNNSNQGQGSVGVTFLKTDRSFIIWLLLSIVTCGIYDFFFIHSMAKDVNAACPNDSEKTPGVGMFILTWLIAWGISLATGVGTAILNGSSEIRYAIQSGNIGYIAAAYGGLVVPSIIANIIRGIYPLYWRYKLGNKLQRNGNEYGIIINENGSTVILWDLIGIVCCCLGSWYALYILIKNTNTICTAYNNKYVLNR